MVVGIAGVVMAPAAQAAPECFGKKATIEGTNGNDNLEGTDGDDVIVGKDGNDEIVGNGGDDRICGNGGDDTLDYEISDRVAGNDKLDGGNGVDALYGGPFSGEHNILLGGPGNDTCCDLNAGLYSGEGDDELRGEDGKDLLVDDSEFGGGRDDLFGGGNDDQIDSTDGVKDEVDGGKGHDTCAVDTIDKVHSCHVGGVTSLSGDDRGPKRD